MSVKPQRRQKPSAPSSTGRKLVSSVGPALLAQLLDEELDRLAADALALARGVDHEADEVRRPGLDFDQQHAGGLLARVHRAEERSRLVVALGDGERRGGDEPVLVVCELELADRAHVLPRDRPERHHGRSG